jgi:hypothetical protein
VIAHGGVAGAMVEILVLLAIAGVFASVWLRERRAGKESIPGAEAQLRDDGEQDP